jgi:uncharacterized protein YuzE
MKPQIKYDPKVNILSIRFSNKKSVDSDIKNNVVIDYAANGEVVNLEIMKIDLGEFVKNKTAKDLIPNLSLG